MIPAPLAQREYNSAYAQRLADEFELEAMGFPVVSHRDGIFYIVDGQHRHGALMLLGFDNDRIQCEVYEDLTEADEAELFLQRSNTKAILAFDKFNVSLNAGREIEAAINRVVMANGLHITKRRGHNTVSATATLKKVYLRYGDVALGKTLRVIRDAYGGFGFETVVIEGVAAFLQRYEGQIDEETLITKLATSMGGFNGLMGPANRMRASMGTQLHLCIAASIVDIYNRGRGGKKLADWWAR